MKLTELEPHWTVGHTWMEGETIVRNQDNVWNRHGMGMSFICPTHRDHRIAVFFQNPLDDRPPATDNGPVYWERIGDSFESLTIQPSIDATNRSHCGHWNIANGEVTNA